MALMVQLWRSCEPHQAKRSSTFSPDAAGAAADWAAPPAGEVAAGGGAADARSGLNANQSRQADQLGGQRSDAACARQVVVGGGSAELRGDVA